MIFNVFFFTVQYNAIEKVSLSDDIIRSVIFYTIISVLLSLGSVFMFPSLASSGFSTGGEEHGRMTFLLLVMIEVISKQCMNILIQFTEFLSFFRTPKALWRSFILECLTYIVIHTVLSAVTVILIFAMVIFVHVF